MRILIALWIATLGADRVDLAGGAAPFAVLPFHVLTAAVVLGEWWRRLRTRSLPRVTPAQGLFAALTLGLLAGAAASVLQSGDFVLSTFRIVLLIATAAGATLAIWGMSDREDLLPLLARGAQVGLLLAAVSDLLQLGQFVGALPETLRLGPAEISLFCHGYGIIPRLTGLGLDMNGSGGGLLTQAVLIALGGTAIRFRRSWVLFGAALLLVTLSRSSLLAALPVLLLFPRSLPADRSLRLGAAAACGVIALGATLLLSQGLREPTARALAPLAGRLDPEEASAQSHANLMVRGLEEATASVPRTLLGIGYGTSHRVLADIFPGSKYGNFHTLYLQLWVESGILPLLVFLLLLGLTLHRAQALTGLVIGFAIYNVFYQGLNQPVLWVTLALVWFAARHVAAPRGVAA